MKIKRYIFLFFISLFVNGHTVQHPPIMHARNSILEQRHEVDLLLAEEEKGLSVPMDLLDDLWVHHISQIKKSYHAVVLEDNSSWTIGLFWRFRVKDWEESDEIVLSIHCSTFFKNHIKIHNITKDSVAWGQFNSLPEVDSPQKMYISEINNHFTEIVLNDGSRYTSPHDRVFRNWKIDDLITTCLVIDPPGNPKSKMAILNFYAVQFTWDLTPSSD